MNRILPRKTALVLLILGSTLLLWFPRQQEIARIQREVKEHREQLESLRARHSEVALDLENAKKELSIEQSARDTAIDGLTRELKTLAKIDPESRWSAPPLALPEWNPESPYVWIRKEMVPRLGASAFSEDGSLDPAAAHVLLIDAPMMRELNQRLRKALADYRNVEAAEARHSDEHLPGIAGSPGEKITATIRPLPEQGARYRLEFETALRDLLGEQRANLVTAVGESWLSEQFSESGTEPKTISVIRHPGGSYTISIKSGGNWFSAGGPWRQIEMHIPSSVRPLFAELQRAAADFR